MGHSLASFLGLSLSLSLPLLSLSRSPSLPLLLPLLLFFLFVYLFIYLFLPLTVSLKIYVSFSLPLIILPFLPTSLYCSGAHPPFLSAYPYLNILLSFYLHLCPSLRFSHTYTHTLSLSLSLSPTSTHAEKHNFENNISLTCGRQIIL